MARTSAAAEARRVDPALEIVVFDRGRFASYSQCGLPYLVGGLVPDHAHLIARSVEQFAAQGIAVHLRHEVTAINAAAGKVLVRDLDGGTERAEGYDRLLVATGAAPITPAVPGLDLAGVFPLDVMEDALAIQEYLRAHRPARAVIVGGGYIGLELAENLARLGLQVRIVQRGPQLFGVIDPEMAARINDELARHAVDLSLCDSVIEGCAGTHGRVEHVHTNAGDVPADLVILAIGVGPEVALARDAGIRLGATGAIAVDDRQRTNLADHYAAGDCAEVWHRLLRRPVWAALGTIANKQGRVAGRVAAGGDAAYAGVVGSAITRVFELEVGRTGLTESEAREAGLDIVTHLIESTDHAGYLPDARDLAIKLVAERGTGRLLGGQAVGRGGVAGRIDVLATALYAGLTVRQLTELDLEYAPPFNSVWDPIQVAATALLRQGL